MSGSSLNIAANTSRAGGWYAASGQYGHGCYTQSGICSFCRRALVVGKAQFQESSILGRRWATGYAYR